MRAAARACRGRCAACPGVRCRAEERDAMRTAARLRAAAAAGAVLLFSPCGLAAEGAAALCPSATDIPYSVKTGDTLWTIAARSYCVNEWPPIYFAWETLYQYNRAEIGADPDHIYAGTVVCLPERISREKWR